MVFSLRWGERACESLLGSYGSWTDIISAFVNVELKSFETHDSFSWLDFHNSDGGTQAVRLNPGKVGSMKCC